MRHYTAHNGECIKVTSNRCALKCKKICLFAVKAGLKMYNGDSMVTCSGSLATTNCELRQVRKEATVTVTSGAEVWLERVAA